MNLENNDAVFPSKGEFMSFSSLWGQIRCKKWFQIKWDRTPWLCTSRKADVSYQMTKKIQLMVQ